MIKRIIPVSGEALPVIGLGSWQTFDIPETENYSTLKEVLKTMHAAGGRLIDSSPMYGRSEQVIGDISSGMENADDFFYATKVWTTGEREGIRQLENSLKKMKRRSMDLIQVHNLVDWQTHWHTLRRWKEEGKVRYLGITHYTDAFHDELLEVMRMATPDFVQFNYSITDRYAEEKLLPMAADMGIATIINRPLDVGKLFEIVKNKPLPEWAASLNIDNWAAFFLKYIISHPAVSCVIPATGNPQHAADNFRAGEEPLPDEDVRKEMTRYITDL